MAARRNAPTPPLLFSKSPRLSPRCLSTPHCPPPVRVTTLNPGEEATVTVSFDGSNVPFAYGIPRGADGADGPPGEVTQAVLDAAIAGTAQNPSGIAPLALTISDPPTQGEVQAIMDAYNALLAALQR